MSGELPLSGLRVVDMADEKAELCGRLLADLGAEVLRVEPPDGARSRRLGPFHAGTSLYFAVRNFNKRGVTVDLDTDSGRQRLLDLLSRADVWIETTEPGRLAAAGLAPAMIADRYQTLVATSITDFGQVGPYRDFVATDPVMVAASGMLFRSGSAELAPVMVPGALAYDVGGIVGAFATLTALWHRRTTGRGQHIDVSVMEAAAQNTDWSLPNASAARAAGGQYAEVRIGAGMVYPLYRCADGWVRVVIISTRHWRAMRAWLGEPEILQDDHWDSLLTRLGIQEEILDPLYSALFAARTMVDLATEAQQRGVVMTPVLRPEGVVTAPHYSQRGTFVDVEVAPGVRGPVAASLIEIDGDRAGFRRRAPHIGEHDDRPWSADTAATRLGAGPGGETAAVGGTGGHDDRPGPGGTAASARGAGRAPGLPFSDLRVVDFGHGGVGVEIGRLFAEYGADVVKVESRSYPDFMRLMAGSEMSPSFSSSNRCKRSLGVNIKTITGLQLVKRLIAGADVVVENNATATMDGMGLGWKVLRELNPGLVMVSSQFMGSTGPWKDWRGYGPSTRAVGGLTWLRNFPGSDAPPGAFVSYPDHVAGRVGAVGALAALLGRDRTGAGSHVEVPQVETVIGLLADLLLKAGLEPGSVTPQGNRSERGAPWGVYRCRGDERWCVITCRDDEDWARLRTALNEPVWAADPGLATAAGRRARADEVDKWVGEWTAERTDREVMATLQAHRVPAAMMMYAGDQPDDPHLRQRGYPRQIHQPGTGDLFLEGAAFLSAAMDGPAIGPAPALGQHTRQIARDRLGLDDSEIDRLIAVGVLEVTPASAD
jgi:crotonobetainyl-CoA:carnitine CoA-transferase CaiB-like acyl-CoA transferase